MKTTCFVIMGFGKKKIPNTNITVNLDDTYNYLIKPTLIKKGLLSVSIGKKDFYRGDEVYTTQAIDKSYLSNIYNADIVIADITALNQNAIYELGIRHAMKPKSTIVMCDSQTLATNNFFDLTFVPHITYDSKKQKQIDEINQVAKCLSETISTCIKSSEDYVDSPVFQHNIYELSKTKKNRWDQIDTSLNKEILRANKLIEDENYLDASKKFENILNKFNYLDDEIICSYILAFYKKELSAVNLTNALTKLNKYINLETTTCENALGISAAINLRLFYITKEKNYLYNSIEFYRRGADFESGNIYCGRNYCAKLLKIYRITDDIEIIKEYYYTAIHYAKIYLSNSCQLKRDMSNFNNVWFFSNQADLMLISGTANKNPFQLKYESNRQKSTIEEGRNELIADLDQTKKRLSLLG